MRDSLNQLLSKEMDRKEFLAHLGAGAMALTGITGLLKALTGAQRVDRGYGSGSYGGESRKNIR